MGEIESIKEFPKYAFITFKNQSLVSKLLNSCPYQPFQSNPFKVQDRIISKLEWNRLMTEYHQTKLNESNATMEPRKHAEYEKGCILYFSNSHPKSNSRTIKMIFELVAPVVFIDYNDQDGYCRFKSSLGATRAVCYFSRCNIVQQHGKDTTGKLDPYYEHQGIQTRLLEGREEREYWDYIFQKQNEKLGQEMDQDLDSNTHTRFNNEAIQAPIHIKFDNEIDNNPKKRKHLE